MQERGIHAAERLKVRRLFPHALPLFIMAVVTLLAVFGPDEDLFDLRHPFGRSLRFAFLRNRPFVVEAVDGDYEKDEQPSQQSVCLTHIRLVPLAPDKMEIDAPPDWITGIRRLIGPDGEVAFLRRLFNGPSEIQHVS